MQKLDYIYRPVKIEDYNRVVDTINSIMDKLEDKPTIQLFWSKLDVKDIHEVTNLDITLPYNRAILITDKERLEEVSAEFNIPYETSKTIIDYLGMRLAVNLNIHFEESPEVKEIAITQGEVSLESLEKPKKNVTPKKGGKKKDGTAKPTRSTAKKNSGTSKGGIRKRKS